MAMTLAELRTMAQRLADMENDTGFIPSAEWLTYINRGCRRIHDILVDVGGEAFVRKLDTSISTVADTATVSYPTDHRKVVGISVTISGSDIPVQPLDFERRDRFEDVSGWDDHTPIYYSLEDSTIRFFPTPTAVHALRIWYLRDFTELASDGDSFDAYGYEDYAAYHAAIMALIKEKSETAEVRAERDLIESQARSHFSRRDAGHPDGIRDIRAGRADNHWRWR